MSNMLLNLVKDAIVANMLSGEELEVLKNIIKEAISIKEEENEKENRVRVRKDFISQVVAQCQEINMPLSEEQLRAVGEYIYDTEIMSMSADDILDANL